MRTLHGILTLSLLLGSAAAAHALPRPAVIELFTSEGCSSCPPAEALIGELAQRPGVLALAFHVDYWDDLGWRDRFGFAEAAQRQRGYARALRLPSIYTPQAVIDGQGDFVGSNRRAIDAALSAKREGVAVELAVHDGQLVVDLGASASSGVCDVLLVAYRRQALSAIGRGENAGRTLTEYNIVRAVRSLGTWHGPGEHYHAALATLPGDATDVAVLVQSAGQAAIQGAATHAVR
jgi:hypothetical protein